MIGFIIFNWLRLSIVILNIPLLSASVFHIKIKKCKEGMS